MNILTTKRIQTIIILNAVLLGASSNLYGRETDGFLARPLAWISNCFSQLKILPSAKRNTLPKERLAYKAAQVNGAIGAQLTQIQRDILIKNLLRFKELVLNAHDHPEAQNILDSIITPEQRGKQQQPLKGALLYAQQFAQDEDKPFLLSPLGTQSLSQLLMHAPHKLHIVSKIERLVYLNSTKTHIAAQAAPLLKKLNAIQKAMKEAELNPEIIAFNNDPILLESQQKLEKIQELLKQKEPELEKLMPLLEKKGKETEAKIIRIANQKDLSQAQKEEQAQAIAEEMRMLLAQYPLVQEMVELEQQQITLATELQKRVKKMSEQYPAVQQLAQLMQEEPAVIDEYNTWAYADQNAPASVDKVIAAESNKIWRSHVNAWFGACIKALQEDAQPEQHILFHEQRFNAERAQWHSVIKGWKDLDAYIAYRALNIQNKARYSNEYLESQYKRLDKTVDDIKKETYQKISRLLNIPEDTKGALETLGITDIDPKNLSQEHRSVIRKQFHKQSLACHSDKNPGDQQTADARQALVNGAYNQLNTLLDNGFSELSQEQKDTYKSLQEELRYAHLYLRQEFMEAQRNIDVVENPIKREKMLKRDLESNTAFKKLFYRELMMAKKSALELANQPYPQESVAQSKYSTALIVRDRT